MKDRFIGLLFILIGTVFGIGAQNYNLGTWDSPGPGLFPTLCSVVVFVIGIISIIKSFTQPSSSVDFKIKYIGLITSSLILFAVVTEYLGIICGIVVLVLGTSLSSSKFSINRLIKLIIGLSIAALVFKYLLGLNLPLWKF